MDAVHTFSWNFDDAADRARAGASKRRVLNEGSPSPHEREPSLAERLLESSSLQSLKGAWARHSGIILRSPEGRNESE